MDQSYESLLPLIRLRNEAPEWILPLLLGFIAALVLSMIAYPFIRKFRWQRHLWRTFADSARERGLSEKEEHLLEGIARSARMKHPLLLLTSLKAFDKHVGGYAHRVDRENKKTAPPDLKDIAEIRRKLDFDRPAPGQPVYSTRTIQIGQTIMVWPVSGGPKGFCSCFVVHVDERAIAVVPLLIAESRQLEALSQGDKVKVRFWPEGDTEYRFRSQVIEAMSETATLKIRHAERLEKIQKRDFFRLDTSFRVSLIPAPAKPGGDESAAGAEPHPGDATKDEEKPAVIDASVFNVSGGGLGVATREALEPDTVLTVDPKFKNSFPIAGLQCRVVRVFDHRKGHGANLEFVDFPTSAERDLIRAIYAYQKRRVIG